MPKKDFKSKKKYIQRSPDQHGSVFFENACVSGALLTCPEHKERFAVRDIYRVFNEHFDAKFGSADADRRLDEAAKLALGEGSGGLLSQVPEKTRSRFQQIECKAKGVIFVMFQDKEFEDYRASNDFVCEILDQIRASAQPISRSIFRMLPVDIACRANAENLTRYLKTRLEKLPRTPGLTWTLLYKCRNNSSFDKKKVMAEVAALVPSELSYVQYNGDFSIMVDITQKLLCISVLRLFKERKRFCVMVDEKEEAAEDKADETEKVAEDREKTIETKELPKVARARPEGTNQEDIDIF